MASRAPFVRRGSACSCARCLRSAPLTRAPAWLLAERLWCCGAPPGGRAINRTTLAVWQGRRGEGEPHAGRACWQPCNPHCLTGGGARARREGATLSGRLCAQKVLEAAPALARQPEPGRAPALVAA